VPIVDQGNGLLKQKKTIMEEVKERIKILNDKVSQQEEDFQNWTLYKVPTESAHRSLIYEFGVRTCQGEPPTQDRWYCCSSDECFRKKVHVNVIKS